MNVEIVRYERYGVAAVTAAAAASLKEYETRARKRNKTHWEMNTQKYDRS